MATVTWPEGLGFCLAEGYEETLPLLAQRTSVDAGPPKQRRITTSAAAPFNCAYLMTLAEKEWLEAFFRGDAAGGAVWFDWLHPVRRMWVPARFMAEQPPKFSAKPPSFIAQVSLEFRPTW